MGKSSDASTAVYPKLQARRITAVAQAEFLARARRDAALLSVDLAPEGLALIGGSECRTPKHGAGVALWLWMVAEATGYNAAATALLWKIEGDVGGYTAAASASVPLARRMLAMAVSLAEDGQPLTDPTRLAGTRQKLQARWAANQQNAHSRMSGPVMPDDMEPARLGAFWASVIEAADLTETAADLYLSAAKSPSPEIPATTISEGSAVLHKSARATLKNLEADNHELNTEAPNP